jgi:hypothetical protein
MGIAGRAIAGAFGVIEFAGMGPANARQQPVQRLDAARRLRIARLGHGAAGRNRRGETQHTQGKGEQDPGEHNGFCTASDMNLE